MPAHYRLRVVLVLAVGLLVAHPPVITALSGAGGEARPWVGYALVLGVWAAYICWIARVARDGQSERP